MKTSTQLISPHKVPETQADKYPYVRCKTCGKYLEFNRVGLKTGLCLVCLDDLANDAGNKILKTLFTEAFKEL